MHNNFSRRSLSSSRSLSLCLSLSLLRWWWEREVGSLHVFIYLYKEREREREMAAAIAISAAAVLPSHHRHVLNRPVALSFFFFCNRFFSRKKSQNNLFLLTGERFDTFPAPKTSAAYTNGEEKIKRWNVLRQKHRCMKVTLKKKEMCRLWAYDASCFSLPMLWQAMAFD